MPSERQHRRTEKILFGTVFAALTALAAWPILSSAWLPLVDLPEHASQVALWRAFATDADVQAHYTLHLSSPYSGFYFLWRVLVAMGFGIRSAGNLLVALSVMAVPLGVLALLKSCGRPGTWAVAVFPFVFTKPLAWGMVPFYFTFAFFFFAFAFFARWLAWPRLFSGLTVAVLGLLLLWSHPLTAGFWGLACGLLALLDRIPLRRRLLALLPLLPAGFGLLAYAASRSNHGVVAPDFRAQTTDWLGAFFLSAYDGTTAEVTARAGLMEIVLAAIVLAGAAASLLARDRRRWDGHLPLLAAAAVALLLYLFLPFRMFSTDFVNVRFASIALFLGITALPVVPWRALRVGLLLCIAGIAFSVDIAVHQAYAEFNRDVGDPEALFAKLPRKASVGWPLNASRDLPPFEIVVLDNFAAWAQLQTIGPAPSFTDREHMLVRDATPVPDPRFDVKLAQGADGALVVTSEAGRWPDVLLFATPLTPPNSLPGASRGPYRLIGRSGVLNAYLLEPALR
jgi:hypothetical protein